MQFGGETEVWELEAGWGYGTLFWQGHFSVREWSEAERPLHRKRLSEKHA